MCNTMRQALKWNCLKLISKMANRFIMSPVVLIVLTIVVNQANGQGRLHFFSQFVENLTFTT